MTRRVQRPARADTVDDSTLGGLNRRLTQQRARARRARRKYAAGTALSDPAKASQAHRQWSEAVDDVLRITEAISVEPAHNLRELLFQFEAAWEWIREDDEMLDSRTRQWLGRFRRSLRRLAREG